MVYGLLTSYADSSELCTLGMIRVIRLHLEWSVSPG